MFVKTKIDKTYKLLPVLDFKNGTRKVIDNFNHGDYKKTHDTVPAILQEGEIVIPKRYAHMVEKYLINKKIYLPK